MSEEHGKCPNCDSDWNGELIYTTFYNRWLEEHSPHDHIEQEAKDKALKSAAMYGATQFKGMWGRQIGIYSMEKDRTVAYKCPDCGHETERK